MGVGDIAWLVMWVNGRRGEDPVRVVGEGTDAQGHLVNDSASLRMGETVAVLEEGGRSWRRGASRQNGMALVMSRGEGTSGRAGEKGMRGQALGVCVRGGRSMCRAAVWQVCESVCVDSGGDVGVRSQRTVVAVPLFVAVV